MVLLWSGPCYPTPSIPIPTPSIHGQVPHLASFYEQSNARNVLGDGVLHDYHDFTGVDDIVLADIVRTESMPRISRAYLRAGPRPTLCFNPKDVRAAVVTCGGLCPGLNNIVRDVTKTLLNLYGAEAVYGVRGGYWGFHESADRCASSITLTPSPHHPVTPSPHHPITPSITPSPHHPITPSTRCPPRIPMPTPSLIPSSPSRSRSRSDPVHLAHLQIIPRVIEARAQRLNSKVGANCGDVQPDSGGHDVHSDPMQSEG